MLIGKLKCFNQVARALIEAESRFGARLSPSQRQFVILQSKKNVLLALGKKRKRSNDEDAMLRSLQSKIKNSRRNFDSCLIIKLPVKTDAERQSKKRKKRTEEEVEKEKSDLRVRVASMRAGGLSAERMVDLRAGRKKNKDTSVFSGDALKSKEIEEGTFIVEPLTGGRDGLGNLGDVSCQHCGALRHRSDLFVFCEMISQRWNHETSPSMCCQGGKVMVPAYPPPPPELMRLWFDNTLEARLFRQHSRSINNATCLSSFMVNERRHDQGTSSVVLQGKLTQLIGSLQPAEGTSPKFSQLYTVDAALEASSREGSLYLPDSLSSRQKKTLTILMWKVVAILRRENALVADFTMACEAFDQQEVSDGRVVISTKAKPAEAHERTYNLQVFSDVFF